MDGEVVDMKDKKGKSTKFGIKELENFMQLISLRARLLNEQAGNRVSGKLRGVGYTRKAYLSDKAKKKKRKVAYQSRKTNRQRSKK